MACEELVKALERIVELATPDADWLAVSDGAFLRRCRVIALDAIREYRCPDPDTIPAEDVAEALALSKAWAKARRVVEAAGCQR